MADLYIGIGAINLLRNLFQNEIIGKLLTYCQAPVQVQPHSNCPFQQTPRSIKVTKSLQKSMNCQALVPSPPVPSPKSPIQGTGADNKVLWATTHPPTPPITFKHEGVLW